MKLIVNDANVLIDIVELKILPHFFQLKMSFLTTSLVLDELFEEQQERFIPYIKKTLLQVEELTSEELIRIKKLQRIRPHLSEQDCSAFFQAQKHKAILLTSDNQLRKFSKEETIEVHGHLWIFDKMVEGKTITPVKAAKKLHELCTSVNPKLGLPQKECTLRIKKWSK